VNLWKQRETIVTPQQLDPRLAVADTQGMSRLYSCENLRFSYVLGSVPVAALKGVDLTLESGELVALSGPSGSGKSTLLNLLGLIEAPQEGRLELFGRDVARLSEREKNEIRRHKVGFIFQSFHLFNALSAAENVEYFLHKQGVAAPERTKRVEQALSDVGLWEHRMKRPLQMSGGQRQRVAVARAIAKRSEIIIADEPTASLDQNTGQGLMELLARINRERGTTIVVSSHDPMVLSFVPKIIRLVDGRITHASP
jgi:putative ABC transport system ATP-binding protein